MEVTMIILVTRRDIVTEGTIREERHHRSKSAVEIINLARGSPDVNIVPVIQANTTKRSSETLLTKFSEH